MRLFCIVCTIAVNQFTWIERGIRLRGHTLISNTTQVNANHGIGCTTINKLVRICAPALCPHKCKCKGLKSVLHTICNHVTQNFASDQVNVNIVAEIPTVVDIIQSETVYLSF